MTSPARLQSALELAYLEIHQQRVALEALSDLFEFAMGDGPLPRDAEAERAVWAYLVAALESHGWRVASELYGRVKGLLSTRCPSRWADPGMPWSVAVKRLQAAAELRRAMGRTKEALRRGACGDRVGMIRALRGAVDVFGEPRASDLVELQWRVAELEARVRELEEGEGRLE
jgi:hypothetical protein